LHGEVLMSWVADFHGNEKCIIWLMHINAAAHDFYFYDMQ